MTGAASCASSNISTSYSRSSRGFDSWYNLRYPESVIGSDVSLSTFGSRRRRIDSHKSVANAARSSLGVARPLFFIRSFAESLEYTFFTCASGGAWSWVMCSSADLRNASRVRMASAARSSLEGRPNASHACLGRRLPRSIFRLYANPRALNANL